METIDGQYNVTTGQTIYTEEFEKQEENYTTEDDEGDDVQYDKPSEILYFTNRFELGLENCYDKLNKVSKVLGSVSLEEFNEAEKKMSRQAQEEYEAKHKDENKKEAKMSLQNKTSVSDKSNKNAEFGFTEDLITGYKIKVEAKGLDYKGREIASSKDFDTLELAAAYLKLINVPCMFDIGTQAINPTDQ